MPYDLDTNAYARESDLNREIDRIEREGVWGIIGEYWDGAEWQIADSCWGFVGDDLELNGYDDDIRRATLDAYKKCLAAQARALEAARPDMYAA